MANSRKFERAPTLSAPESTKSSGLRILVVEDNADSANSEAIFLRLFGHEVTIAQDGPTAMALAGRQEPDVILLDIGLPGIDGWEVAKFLRQRATVKKPILIAITGFGQKQDICHSAETGIDLHLLKPVDPEYLNSILRRIQESLPLPLPWPES